MDRHINEETYKNLSVPVEESYKVLRTNIQFCSTNSKVKSIALTSLNPGEGKTTTSMNLAVSMAKSGLKTLLLDADMRKPALENYFNIDNSKGLSNYLYGQDDFFSILTSTDIDNLKFTPCGPKPPDPSELLSSERFEKFVKEAGDHFDMIIIDTPPLGSVIDAAIIGAKVNGCIIVIRHKMVSARNALRVKDQLLKVNAKILGVVLNRMPKSEYKSYYNYYNYYGQKEESEHLK